ncbi:helix-turn-helix domain-containing protein [uncultured Hyphomonas sp.]|uniref:helix-turn-helix domain-containing protein n=1 Tax=uncultured Hyphomonas sp. TaxID=225298 RepID=UPI002AAA8F61|nr:helix-turn-helix domain-containing protein [uncultured Hyphomonas sp.]
MSSETNDDLIFKALAAPVRRQILDALRDNPQTTGELCARFADLNRCTVMQHLGVLEEADLVLVRRVGRVRWNYLNAIPIKRIHDRWIGPYAARAVDMLDELKCQLETDAAPAAQPAPSTG